MTKTKRTYKVLTQWQETGAISLAQKGWSQKRIAKSLGVSKQRIATALKAKKVGKRQVGTFWSDVRKVSELYDESWKEARKRTYHMPKWSKKRATRAGKKYRTWADFWEEEGDRIRALSEEEKKKAIEEELEETYLDTPK